MEEIRTIERGLEAILLVHPEPIPEARLRALTESVVGEEAAQAHFAQAWEQVRQRWGSPQGGFSLAEVAGGFCLRTDPSCAAFVAALRERREAKLSRAALETLAVIAYRQPVTKGDLDDIRGVDCGATLRFLLDRGLIRILAKKEEPGRPLVYGTTKDFLSVFNLQHLAQLPTLQDFAELRPDDPGTESDDATVTLSLPNVDGSIAAHELPAELLDEALRRLGKIAKKTQTELVEQGFVAAQTVVEESASADGG